MVKNTNSSSRFASLRHVFVIFAQNIGIRFGEEANTLGQFVIGSYANNSRSGNFFWIAIPGQSIRRSLLAILNLWLLCIFPLPLSLPLIMFSIYPCFLSIISYFLTLCSPFPFIWPLSHIFYLTFYSLFFRTWQMTLCH